MSHILMSVECPACDGNDQVEDAWDSVHNFKAGSMIRCSYCRGAGEVMACAQCLDSDEACEACGTNPRHYINSAAERNAPNASAEIETENARLRTALRALIVAVDEYPGAYPNREAEVLALVAARAALANPVEAKDGGGRARRG